MRVFEFWYDVVCPYAYLGSTQIAALEAETGAEALYGPFLLGGVFKSFGRGLDREYQVRAAPDASTFALEIEAAAPSSAANALASAIDAAFNCP